MKGCLTLIILVCLVYFGYQYLIKKPSSKNSFRQTAQKTVRNIPKSFAMAATREGYKTDVTADELVAMAKKEGFTPEEIKRHIKDTPWEKSQLVADAIKKYYAIVTEEVEEKAPEVKESLKSVSSETETALVKAKALLKETLAKDFSVEDIKTEDDVLIPVVNPSSFSKLNGVYNKDNDSLFEKKDELIIDFNGNTGLLTYKDREMVTIKYKVKLVNNEIVSSEYYYDDALISSKKDAYLYLDSDKKIMKRFERYAGRKGILVKNPIF